MSLLTVKHVIKSLTTGMCCLVTVETTSSITFALGQLTTERDTMCPSTVKHVINILTTGMSGLVTLETISSISFALCQLTAEGTKCVPLDCEARFQQSNHKNVKLGNHGDSFIDYFCLGVIDDGEGHIVSLLTVKHFINHLTNGMSDFVSMETIFPLLLPRGN